MKNILSACKFLHLETGPDREPSRLAATYNDREMFARYKHRSVTSSKVPIISDIAANGERSRSVERSCVAFGLVATDGRRAHLTGAPTAILLLLLLSFAIAPSALAGKAQKWTELPEAVRATILANGGAMDGRVDKESEKIDGKVIYEAEGKDKNGNDVDLVINQNGKLVETKNDDAAERIQAKAIKPVKALKGVTFSNPRKIDNQYLPLASLKADILEGTEGAKKIRIERTAKPDLHKTFQIGNQSVEALAVEDREFENGQIAEMAMDYFAQADDGTVYYLGEDVDEYKDGKIFSHEGSWMLGRDTQKPGVILPGQPKMGARFKSEDVSKEIHEDDDVVSVSEKVQAPAGSYEHCIKVREKLADGVIEYKFYAAGVGVVREQPAKGDVLLKSHQAR